VLAVTHNPFVAYTSNIAAVLGLRSMFFALEGALDKLRYLHYGLAALLGFVALKMLAGPWFDIPISTSLIVIGVIMAVCVAASMLAGTARDQRSGVRDQKSREQGVGNRD
jgi:tellurite resistance protein TerC